ncbi:MAG: hypothetical protein ABIO71_10100 [Caldimonas sp.]
MNSPHAASLPLLERRPWDTASFADAGDTAPMDIRSLEAHVDHCNGSRGRWFAMQCAADAFLGFASARLVTTGLLVALVLGVASIVA